MAGGPGGMVGALPVPAVLDLLRWLEPSGTSAASKQSRRAFATVRALRLVCRRMKELVGEYCVCGAGLLDVGLAAERAALEEMPTAGFGRALMVFAMSNRACTDAGWREIVDTMALAVQRGHMIWLQAPARPLEPQVVRALEKVLVEASREDQLRHADLGYGQELGWSVDAMAQLSDLALLLPAPEVVAEIVAAGHVKRLQLQQSALGRSVESDVSALAALNEVDLVSCPGVKDLAPLARVPRLSVVACFQVTSLPAMHNDYLLVGSCMGLADISGLARGNVGCLILQTLVKIDDVSVIGRMQPPPRMVMLIHMRRLRDVSMLSGVHRLEVMLCPKLDKAATVAALRGTVGVIRFY